MEQCWKIRGLADTPDVTLSTVQARDAKKKKRQQGQLMVVQCANCALTLQRTILAHGRLRTQPIQVEQLSELQRVRVKAAREGALLYCGKCSNRIATSGMGTWMQLVPQSLNMVIPEGPEPDIFSFADQREPYCSPGARSGLSHRTIMNELHRLAYTKQARYRLTLRDYFERLKGYQAKFKGLHNLILLNQSTRQGPSKPLPPSAQKLSFSKLMRSTTVEHSHSRHQNSRLGRSKRRGSNSPVDRL